MWANAKANSIETSSIWTVTFQANNQVTFYNDHAQKYLRTNQQYINAKGCLLYTSDAADE